MTNKARVEQELGRLRPQFSQREWFTFEDIIKASLERLAADLCCGHCDCLDNSCPVHGIGNLKR